MRHWHAFALGILALTAGCSTSDETPLSSPTSLPFSADSPASNVDLAEVDVPAVENPLDISRFLDDPCTSLTDEQINEYLGSDTERDSPEEDITGPSCSWYSGMRSNAQIAVTYPRITDEGLTAIYRNRDMHEFFEENPVQGYPAVAYGDRDKRQDGECLITVGTSDTDYVNVHLYLGKGSAGQLDPCDAVHEVATAAVENIKAANAGTSSVAPDVPAVPRVDEPLNLGSFLDDPCSSLTGEQVIEYLGDNVESEVGTERSSGPACSWYSGMRSNAQVTVTYPRLTDEGLTAIYRNRDAHAYFIETAPVAGYPAVSYGGVDLRDEGECLVTVGTSNSDYVNIDVYLGKGSAGQLDPCDAAHEVATTVVGNIRSAQSAG